MNSLARTTFLGKILGSFFEPAGNQVTRLTEKFGSVLSVGCGASLRFVVTQQQSVVGLDIVRPSLELAKLEGRFSAVVLANGLALPFKDSSFDCVLALDVVEHLPKEAAYASIREMVRVARRMVVVFTPNGYFPQVGFGGNPHQEHLSGWTTRELEEAGFQVRGSNGVRLMGTWLAPGALGITGRGLGGCNFVRSVITLVIGSLPGCAHHLMAVMAK